MLSNFFGTRRLSTRRFSDLEQHALPMQMVHQNMQDQM